ncbi:MAG: bifunctional 5,10-methylenetetrahydrofolate dehydrogenase/5,10-methenyltetrahydrofolate cyclohydrolase [bacterium]
MAIVFDGRSYASGKEEDLKKKVLKLKEKGVVPRLESIVVGEDPASLLYVNLKKKAAEKIGAEVEIVHFDEALDPKEIILTIKKYNKNPKVSGIMVQMPLPDAVSDYKLQIINSIDPKKDVDGLRENSFYVHPTAMAVLQIIEVARLRLASARQAKTICVIGKGGMVGSALLEKIKDTDYKLMENSKDADILVSTTGSPNLVKADMVKEGVVVIDVGFPKGDVDPSVYPKASFYTPVPGGVGPVTITCLLENLAEASRV